MTACCWRSAGIRFSAWGPATHGTLLLWRGERRPGSARMEVALLCSQCIGARDSRPELFRAGPIMVFLISSRKNCKWRKMSHLKQIISKLDFSCHCFSLSLLFCPALRLLHFVSPVVCLEDCSVIFTAKLLDCKKYTFWWEIYRFDVSYLLIFFHYTNIVLTLTVEAETLPMYQQKLAQLSSSLWGERDIALLLRRHRMFAETQTSLQSSSDLALHS